MNIKKIVIIICICIVPVMLTYIIDPFHIISNLLNTAPGSQSGFIYNNKHYPVDMKKFIHGIKVGKITIYPEDIITAYETYYPNTETERQKAENWYRATYQLNNTVILQNEGIKLGLFPPGNGRLDYKKADMTKKYIENNMTESMSVERISIFYHNYLAPSVANPKVGVEKAKTIAWAVLNDLQIKISSGQMTMKEAGDAIRSMTELEDVDLAYKLNAYQNVTRMYRGDYPFDKKLVDAAWGMQKGEISGIIMSESNENGIYAILKVTDKNSGEYHSLNELFQKRKNEGLKLTLE